MPQDRPFAAARAAMSASMAAVSASISKPSGTAVFCTAGVSVIGRPPNNGKCARERELATFGVFV
jgi:hypothetical protein